MEHHLISAQHLSIDRIREILFRRLPLALSDDARMRIVRCREYLDRKMENPERPVYGITTGFGSLCDISVGYDELAQLQKNLVMSHACGTGERVPSEIVKLILLLKIQSLSYGHSGVQLATVERLIDFFNNDVLPVVYQQGSLGASGDLAPLAHMSLPLLGLGEVECEGRVRPAAEVLSERGWQPIRLESKEGLALLNGTQFMSAYGVWSLIGARRLSEWADRIGALSLDAFDGRIEPFCPASFDESSAACRILRRGCKRLRAAILAGGYDAVVCVHLFPALMLTFIQREAPLPIKTMFIATDYTASPSCDRMRLDTCVIPDAALTELFAKNGVSPDTIAPLGIPVRAELYSCLPVQEAKKAVGLDPSHRHLLMMTGSMGCGPMEEITQLLANSLPAEYDVTVACSSNRQLLRRMRRKFADRPNIHICGYISDVSVMMDSADLFLTKPGGISTTEAMVKGLPMVLVNVVGGCETPNLEFFVSHGGAATADTPEAIAALCKRLLEQDEERLIMRQSLLAMHKTPAAQAICDRLEA